MDENKKRGRRGRQGRLRRILAAVLAAVFAVLHVHSPDFAYAVGEIEEVVPHVSLECLTPAEEITPGSRVSFQVSGWLTEEMWGCEDAVMIGIKFIIPAAEGLEFDDETVLTPDDAEWCILESSMDEDTGDIETLIYLYWEGDYYDEMLVSDGTVVATYTAKISEDATSGQVISHTAAFGGDDGSQEKYASETVEITVAGGSGEDPEDPDDPGSDDPDEPSQEPNWYLKRISEESTKTAFSVTFRIMQREEEA